MTTSASSHWISPDLVTRAQQGDHSAFAAIVTHHQADLWGYVYRLMRDRADDVDDVIQQTWLLAWQYLTTPTSPAHHDPHLKVAGWLYRLAFTVSRNASLTRSHHPLVSWDQLRAAGAPDPPTPPASGPEGAALQREDAAELQALLEQLPPADREALVLKEQGWPDRALAQRWGLNVGLAKHRVARARLRFRAVYAAAVCKPPLPPRQVVPPGVYLWARAPSVGGHYYMAYGVEQGRKVYLGMSLDVRKAVAYRRVWEARTQEAIR